MRSLNVRNPSLVRQAKWQWRSTREGRARKGRGERTLSGAKKYTAARGDPDAGPTPDEVRFAAMAVVEPTPNTRVPPLAPALR